jgi:hypothetical protein
MERFDTVNEQTTARYTAKLLDEIGAAVPSSALTSLTLLLYDKATGQILNSRNTQNVLNANGVSIDGSGNLTWVMDPADNAIVTDSNATEVHIAVFIGRWGVTKKVTHDLAITVRNLRLS